MALSLRFHQAGLFEDSHVMGNGGLRQLHTLLDIGGAEPGFLVEGASAFFLARAEFGGEWDRQWRAGSDRDGERRETW